MNVKRFVGVFLFSWLGMALLAQADSTAQRKFEMARKKAVREIEKDLVTKGGAGDAETVYVILLMERADRVSVQGGGGGRGGRGSRGRVSFTAANSNNCIKVTGKHAAAEAVVNFMMSAPQAQNQLKSGGGRGLTSVSRDWDFRAFRSESDAQALYTSLSAKTNAGKKK